MPIALFFLSTIMASIMYLSVTGIVQSSHLNQYQMTGTAAFQAASSALEMAWAGDNQELGVFEDMVLNQDVGLELVADEFEESAESFEEMSYQTGAEIFLFDLSSESVVDAIEVDYCRRSSTESCPEIFVEWFRLDYDFIFSDLGEIDHDESDNSPLGSCLNIEDIHMMRCVTWASGPKFGAVDFRSYASDESFKKSFSLKTDFARYHYLLRFWRKDKRPFYFNAYGLRGARRVPLPGLYNEVDVLGLSQNSYRRIKEQRLSTAGLQDGLGFVHYSQSMGAK